MKPVHIDLQIEELVLHGFTPGGRYHIGEAVESELARLFAEQGTPPSLRQRSEIERLDGRTFEVKPGSGAEAIGVQVAQAVYGGLS
jgi:hypothetical protein